MWVIELLQCPVCRGALRFVSDSSDHRDGSLQHITDACRETYPVISAVPRLLVGSARAELVRDRAKWFERPERQQEFATWGVAPAPHSDLALVRRFDLEWSRFTAADTPEERDLFAQYFDLVPPDFLSAGCLAVDAGSGGGRWAAQVARTGSRVIAVDLGLSVDIVRSSIPDEAAVAVVQADVRELPLRDGIADIAYSLGVLHHLEETNRALREIRRTIRPGGLCLIYLYYALDGRSRMYRAVFQVANALRNITVRLPYTLLLAVSFLFAALVYWPASRVARLLRSLGLSELAAGLPLSFYADLSFRTMWNDSLDRFGTVLEKRFSRADVTALLKNAALVDIRISDEPPYWHAIGHVPPADASSTSGRD